MKKGKKKRKTIKNAMVTILFLALGTCAILFAFLYFFTSGDRNLSGEWTAEIDVTQQAAVTALDWLQDIEAVSISLEDMESYMENLTIQLNMTLEQTSRSEGTFHCHISPESYEACKQAAYQAFAQAFRELLGERLRMAGYEGDVEPEEIENLAATAFGMSTESYLMSYGPVLLPSLENMQAQYEGHGRILHSQGRQPCAVGRNRPRCIRRAFFQSLSYGLYFKGIRKRETAREAVNAGKGRNGIGDYD